MRYLWFILLLLAACAGEASPTITPASVIVTPPAPAFAPVDEAFCPMPRGWFVYVTRAGDTLTDIAERANSTVNELATANCLQNPTTITAGTRLYVPQRIN